MVETSEPAAGRLTGLWTFVRGEGARVCVWRGWRSLLQAVPLHGLGVTLGKLSAAGLAQGRVRRRLGDTSKIGRWTPRCPVAMLIPEVKVFFV